jgi:hypothetical protein
VGKALIAPSLSQWEREGVWGWVRSVFYLIKSISDGWIRFRPVVRADWKVF